jgi:hypothetical protein
MFSVSASTTPVAATVRSNGARGGGAGGPGRGGAVWLATTWTTANASNPADASGSK